MAHLEWWLRTDQPCTHARLVFVSCKGCKPHHSSVAQEKISRLNPSRGNRQENASLDGTTVSIDCLDASFAENNFRLTV